MPPDRKYTLNAFVTLPTARSGIFLLHEEMSHVVTSTKCSRNMLLKGIPIASIAPQKISIIVTAFNIVRLRSCEHGRSSASTRTLEDQMRCHLLGKGI
jgi:hypothetical protein